MSGTRWTAAGYQEEVGRCIADARNGRYTGRRLLGGDVVGYRGDAARWELFNPSECLSLAGVVLRDAQQMPVGFDCNNWIDTQQQKRFRALLRRIGLEALRLRQTRDQDLESSDGTITYRSFMEGLAEVLPDLMPEQDTAEADLREELSGEPAIA